MAAVIEVVAVTEALIATVIVVAVLELVVELLIIVLMWYSSDSQETDF